MRPAHNQQGTHSSVDVCHTDYLRYTFGDYVRLGFYSTAGYGRFSSGINVGLRAALVALQQWYVKEENMNGSHHNNNMENGHAQEADSGSTGEQTTLFLIKRLSCVSVDLSQEHDKLQTTHLSENADFQSLKTALRKVCSLGQDVQVPLVELGGHLCRVREKLTGINKTIERKLTDEGLKSWINRSSVHHEGKVAIALLVQRLDVSFSLPCYLL